MNSPTLIHRTARPIKILPESVWSLARAYAAGIFTPFRFSTVTGHWRSSLRRAACDRTGKAIPWCRYPATDFLPNAIFGIRQSLSSEADSSLPTNWRISAIRRVPLPIAKCWTLALVDASDTILLKHDSSSSIVST